MKDKKKISIIVLSVFAIIAVISVTYAFITQTLTGTKEVVINAGVLDLVLEEENAITISNALPMYDEVGMIQEDVFVFRLVNKTSNPTDYVLKIQEIQTGTLNKSDVKYGLIKDGITTIDLVSNIADGVIDGGTIAGSDIIDYELRLWIDSSITEISQVQGKFLRLKLKASAEQKIVNDSKCESYEETKPNKPELTSGMIAVTYNEIDKTWVKADSTNDDWYDYGKQIWANAVTVTKETRQNYMKMDAGEPISMDDINTMWVWIPRYSYTIKQPYGRNGRKCSELGEITLDSPSNCRKVEYPLELREKALDLCNSWYSEFITEAECAEYQNYNSFEEFIDNNIWQLEDTRIIVETYPDNFADDETLWEPGAIDIKFIKTIEKDAGTGKFEDCVENWVTPEGFEFGKENIPGFWIGKFEVSTLESCTAYGYSENTDCDLLTLTPQIKPNVTSWRGARVSTLFEASRLMQSSDDNLNYNADTYGFDTVGTGSMDAHLLKNTEWGIVTMLSQSRYGKYGNPNYAEKNKEVYQNKSSNYITGMSNGTLGQNNQNIQVDYDTPDTGYGASTTGTIYGVYDMSGGSEEFVMGNYNNISGRNNSDNSGFCGTNGPDENCREWPDEKYYDLYTSETSSEAYKFGDSTYETQGWYMGNGITNTINRFWPWFVRGGQSRIETEVFRTNISSGTAEVEASTRFAIKP